MLKIDKWYKDEKIFRADCYFYPNGGYYAGNLYNKDGRIIGDYYGDDSVEIGKRLKIDFGP